jgi:hypothetical protein
MDQVITILRRHAAAMDDQHEPAKAVALREAAACCEQMGIDKAKSFLRAQCEREGRSTEPSPRQFAYEWLCYHDR